MRAQKQLTLFSHTPYLWPEHAVVRLPSEAEWEKAAREPEHYRYAWGETWSADKGNTKDTGLGLVQK